MFRRFCLLLLSALCVKSEKSWDIAVITKHQLEFYLNGKNLYSESASTTRPQFTALVYDAVYDNLLFADSQYIFKYDIASNKSSAKALMGSKKIGGVAFDPVTEMFFWTDILNKSIHWTSFMDIQIKQDGSRNDRNDNLLISMADDIPLCIAVDSCRGYIYWTNTNIMKPTIERARFDGTKREVLVDNDIFMPVSLAIDQNTKKIYWADVREGIHYSIESADLNGENRKTLLKGTDHRPYSLTISNDYIYWVNSKTIWKLPKDSPNGGQPTNHIDCSYLDVQFGIAANYPIREQIGQNECEALTNLLQKNSNASNVSFNISTDVEWFCVHGKKAIGESVCECTLGYTGERCDISVCHNFCVQGITCRYTSEGQPKCECKKGFAGERCEVDVCRGFCLNDGECSLNDYNEPLCRCFGDHEGLRCETLKLIPTNLETSTTDPANETTVPVCKPGDQSSTQRSEADACHNYCLNEGNCYLDQNQNVPVCHCLNNYTGSRCEILKEQGIAIQRPETEACHNYCLNEGNCSLDQDHKKPICNCLKEYYGSRCETLKEHEILQQSKTDACHNYCLNEGNCSLDLDNNMPVCECLKSYSGSRCEIPIARIIGNSAPCNPQISDNSAGGLTVIILGVLVALLGLSCIGFITVMFRNKRLMCKSVPPRSSRPYN